MDYSIYKENEPIKTIEKIKNILNDVGITLEERILKNEKEENGTPYSLTVFLHNYPEYKAEGKGACIVNAKASGYAEFIERVQNGFIFQVRVDDFVFAPDEKFIKKDLYSETHCVDKKIFFNLNDFVNLNRRNMSLQNINNVLTVPFFGIKENKIVHLPILVYEWLAGSNGMAAGNSIEEALVQSFSEICERYALKQVIENQLVMPDIPEEEYLKYSKILDMLKLYNKNGYIIKIKDASLGLQLPVVCTIIYNSHQNTYTYTFGAHPNLPVAIERCLTEFAQGIDITSKKHYRGNVFLYVHNKNCNITNKEKINKFVQNNSQNEYLEQDVNSLGEKILKTIQIKQTEENELIYSTQYIEKELYEYLVNTNNLNFLFEKQFLHRIDIENCEYIQKMIRKNKPSYLYNRNNWISNTNVDNKFLLKFILNKIQNHTSEIYVRDVSFLGFPAVRVIIPKMSFVYNYDIDRISATKKWINWLKTEFKNERESISELYKSLEIKLGSTFHLDSQFSDLPIEYILFLCAVYLNNVEKILLLANTIINNNKKCKFFKEEFIVRIEIIKEFYKLKSSKNNIQEILEYLSSIYNKEDIKKFKIFMKYLSASVIKILIKPYFPKRNNQLQCNKQEKINDIINKLVKKHKENIVNQAHFKNIF